MGIKERVLSSLKTSYAKYGFKKDELSSLTDIIAANLTEESTDEQVAAAVTAAEGYAKMMQTVYNRGISETNKKYEGYIPKPADPEPPTPPTPPTGNLTLKDVEEAIARANASRQKEIDDAVAKATAPFLKQQEATRLAGLLANHEKLKTIPKVFANKYQLDKEENLDALASQIESDYTAFKQELVSSGQFVEAPSSGSPGSETDDFAEMMKGFSDRNTKPAAEPTK